MTEAVLMMAAQRDNKTPCADDNYCDFLVFAGLVFGGRLWMGARDVRADQMSPVPVQIRDPMPVMSQGGSPPCPRFGANLQACRRRDRERLVELSAHADTVQP